MANYNEIAVNRPAPLLTAEPVSDTVMYCKLFGDVVHEEVCDLRKRILATRKGFSCKGCIVNLSLDGEAC